MKYLEIIEDLDQETLIEFNKHTYSEKLYDCFIRNYHQIKRYCRQPNYLVFSKFKKTIIPKYIAQIDEFIRLNEAKSRKMYYQRRRIINYHFNSNKTKSQNQIQMLIDHRQDSFRLTGQSEFQYFLQRQKIEPSIDIRISGDKIDIKKYEKSLILSKLQRPSLNLKNLHIFENDSPQKNIIETADPQKLNLKNAFHQTINLSKKNLLHTLNQFDPKKKNRKSAEFLPNFEISLKNFYNSEESLENRMISILKHKKAKKKKFNFKNKLHLFTDKNLIEELSEKQNFGLQKIKNSNKKLDKIEDSLKPLSFGLKGKICLPLKHRFSSSCEIISFDNCEKRQRINNRQQSQLRKKKIWELQQILKQIKNIPKSNKTLIRSTKYILNGGNNTSTKKFSIGNLD